MAKSDVNGANTNDVWRWLRLHSSYKGENGTAKLIPWNYAKFLVDASGNVVKDFEPAQDAEEIRPVLEQLFAKKVKRTILSAAADVKAFEQ